MAYGIKMEIINKIITVERLNYWTFPSFDLTFNIQQTTDKNKIDIITAQHPINIYNKNVFSNINIWNIFVSVVCGNICGLDIIDDMICDVVIVVAIVDVAVIVFVEIVVAADVVITCVVVVISFEYLYY